MTERTITLLDGRALGYAQYGPENGQPVLYFHGTPSSRLEIMVLNEFGTDVESWLQQNKVTIIAVDRPGMGLSDFNPRMTFLSFADDVKQLLHSLKITTCPVVSWSGGGPFSLAMAFQYPTIITGVFILCGFTRRISTEVLKQMHANKWYFKAAKSWPALLRWALHLFRKKIIRHPPPQWLTDFPQVDYNLLKNVKHFRRLSDLTIKEACRQSTKGPVHEAALYFKDIGFELSSLIQPVQYWWGTEDKSVIRLHAEEAEKHIPDCTIHQRWGEGHLSLFINYFTEVMHTAITTQITQSPA